MLKNQAYRRAAALAAVVLLLAAWSAGPVHSQSPGSSENSGRDIDAEREAIWNSPDMLSARAYLETYFERSAKISDAEAKKYMADLRSKDPDQMRIWLIKFQDERASVRNRNASAAKGRQMAVSQRRSPSVGGFSNPYSGSRTVSSGLQRGGSNRFATGNSNALAGRSQVRKPFSGPQYDRARQEQGPLVSGKDVARWEIMRGLGFPGY
ncbi:MAG: hypothetical protein AAGA92_10095 [Planctomycetota bacterium]